MLISQPAVQLLPVLYLDDRIEVFLTALDFLALDLRLQTLSTQLFLNVFILLLGCSSGISDTYCNGLEGHTLSVERNKCYGHLLGPRSTITLAGGRLSARGSSGELRVEDVERFGELCSCPICNLLLNTFGQRFFQAIMYDHTSNEEIGSVAIETIRSVGVRDQCSQDVVVSMINTWVI